MLSILHNINTSTQALKTNNNQVIQGGKKWRSKSLSLTRPKSAIHFPF